MNHISFSKSLVVKRCCVDAVYILLGIFLDQKGSVSVAIAFSGVSSSNAAVQFCFFVVLMGKFVFGRTFLSFHFCHVAQPSFPSLCFSTSVENTLLTLMMHWTANNEQSTFFPKSSMLKDSPYT